MPKYLIQGRYTTKESKDWQRQNLATRQRFKPP